MKKKTLQVKASKGMKVPMPSGVLINSTKKFVDDTEFREVLNCSLVRKRIRKGDLLEKTERKPKQLAKTEEKKEG